jgi:hypothetical protein
MARPCTLVLVQAVPLIVYATRAQHVPEMTMPDSAPKPASRENGWTPEFPGQRQPFTDGNEAAVTHGARSERRVGPLAEQIAPHGPSA